MIYAGYEDKKKANWSELLNMLCFMYTQVWHDIYLAIKLSIQIVVSDHLDLYLTGHSIQYRS